MEFQTINPATGQILQTYQEMSDASIQKIIELSAQAYQKWSQLSFNERAQGMQKVSQLLLSNKMEYAQLMTAEMGKPLKAGVTEIEKCALVCEFYAKQAEQYLSARIIETDMRKSYVTYQPMGVVFSIMPWNFPFWQVFRFASPGLMAGNTTILRHAPMTTGCGMAIEKIFKEAGLPQNVFRTVICSNEQAAMIIQQPQIVGVSLTGSERAGAVVGAEAAQALKKVVLELGGSDPYVILEDADLDLAASCCVQSRMANAGQVCVAAKRFIAVESIYDAFQEKVLEQVKTYQMGDPLEDKTTLGPMARRDLRDQLQEQVARSVAQGAKILVGGEPVAGPGNYYPATVLADVKKGMPAYEDELFGPVAVLIKAKDEEEALHIANDTRFGLGAAVFTRDEAKGEAIAAKKLHAGVCVVNGVVTSDPRFPFGGIKGSGYGRELSAEGIQEFLNIKTVWVK